MIFIVIWVGIAILCAVIAANKHRSAVGWLFLGLIFGIFAPGELTLMINRLSDWAAFAQEAIARGFEISLK